LENLQRKGGFKGFNQHAVSLIIAEPDPRKQGARAASSIANERKNSRTTGPSSSSATASSGMEAARDLESVCGEDRFALILVKSGHDWLLFRTETPKVQLPMEHMGSTLARKVRITKIIRVKVGAIDPNRPRAVR